MAGTKLIQVSSSRVKWRTWQKNNPKTQILSTDTGYDRDYTTDPYEGYYRLGTIWFPVGKVRKDLAPKDRVLGIDINGMAKAYSLTKLQKEKGTIKDQLNGVSIRIRLNNDGEVVNVEDDKGNPLPHLFAYWFAWQAFNPGTGVY